MKLIEIGVKKRWKWELTVLCHFNNQKLRPKHKNKSKVTTIPKLSYNNCRTLLYPSSPSRIRIPTWSPQPKDKDQQKIMISIYRANQILARIRISGTETNFHSDSEPPSPVLRGRSVFGRLRLRTQAYALGVNGDFIICSPIFYISQNKADYWQSRIVKYYKDKRKKIKKSLTLV